MRLIKLFNIIFLSVYAFNSKITCVMAIPRALQYPGLFVVGNWRGVSVGRREGRFSKDSNLAQIHSSNSEVRLINVINTFQAE